MSRKIIIGIGAASEKDFPKICRSIENASADAEYIIYTSSDAQISLPPNTSVVITESPHTELASALREGKISAAVRGTLPANETMRALKSAFNVTSLRRIAVLEPSEGACRGKKFLLAPVGVDEGWTVEEKIMFIEDSRRLAESAGIDTRTAVLSGGRTGDIGRHPIVDRTISDAELIAEKTGADNCEILIESALTNHGIIIAPDGISGNLIFRTLCLLGSSPAHGAPVVNIEGIFVDTSRADNDYSKPLLLAASLSKSKQP